MKNMKNFYWNPSEKRWCLEPYGIREHSVVDGPYIATLVVIPVQGKDDDEERWVQAGVRIEDIRDRKNLEGHFLPGYMYFVKFGKMTISETGVWHFKVDLCGTLQKTAGYGDLLKPRVKYKGVPLEDHPLAEKFGSLVSRARESYNLWLMAKRAA